MSATHLSGETDNANDYGLAVALLIGGGITHAQYQYPTADIPTSEPAYIAKVKTAAPEQIVSKASIIMMQDGKPRELQAGSNGLTCLIGRDRTPVCTDQNGLEWVKSVAARTEPPNKIGFIYMLAGDTGTTNHDPHQRDTRLHWVQTGPNVMIVGPGVREMMGYSRTLDVADPSQPYVMFPGTPYEHLMLPTKEHAKSPRRRLGGVSRPIVQDTHRMAARAPGSAFGHTQKGFPSVPMRQGRTLRHLTSCGPSPCAWLSRVPTPMATLTADMDLGGF
jgi:hypothetical protein